MKIPNYCVHNEKEIKGFFGEYRWLSNFWLSPIQIGEFHFNSVEAAYHFAKLADGQWEEEAYEEMRELKAGKLKQWGRSINIRPDWEKVKYEIMAGLVFQKFYQNKDLRKLLLETGDAYLEETNNWHDQTWGCCVCTNCMLSSAVRPQNNLGKIFMKVREFWK